MKVCKKPNRGGVPPLSFPEDLTGQVFGQLVVLEMLPRERDESGHLKPALWLCKCSCGGVKETTARLLKGGCAKSCGCLKWISDHSRQRKPLRRPFRRYFNIKELNEYA